MPIVTPAEALAIGFVIAPLLFAVSAFLTRATGRRIAGGLAGSGAYALSTYLWDRVAGLAGWWHYPFDPSITGRMLALYIPAGIVSRGAFGLIGWRLTRRFGWPGQAAFLLGWGLWGAIHDLGGSVLFASSDLMVFTPGPTPAVADFLNYATCGALAQLAIRLVGGPAAAGSLRGRHRRVQGE
jgi:hypothetical protein